jgi:transcriptional regulator of NAD metabolism
MTRDDSMHTCHDQCERPACVAVREAVAAERERCAKALEELHRLTRGGHNHYLYAARVLRGQL